MSYPVQSPQSNQPLYRLGLFGDVFRELCRSGIDPTLIMAVLLAFVSLLVQGQAYLLWPNGLRSPIGSNLFMVAPSGAGKSLLIRLLFGMVHDYLAKLEPDEDGFVPTFFIEDASPEVLIHDLKRWPFCLALYEEGGMLAPIVRVPKGRAKLAKLIDGTRHAFSRVSTGDTVLQGHAFSIAAFEQAEVWEETKASLLGTGGSIGVQNRCLFFHGGFPISDEQANSLRLSEDVLQRLSVRVKECLDLSIQQAEEGGLKRTAVPFSGPAEWGLADRSRGYMMPGATPAQVEHGARSPERRRKLATALWVFEHGPVGAVSLEYLQAASWIDEQSSRCFAELTYEPPQPTAADKLIQAFQQYVQQTGITRLRLSEITASAFNLGLTPAQIKAAVAELGGRHIIWVETKGKTTWVNYRPLFIH